MLLQLKNVPNVATKRDFFFPFSFGFLITFTMAFFIIATNGEKGHLLQPSILKEDHQIAFGKVVGEDRGDNLMDPPIYHADPYFWLRDQQRENQTIIDLLKNENAYTAQTMLRLNSSINELNNELFSHFSEKEDYDPILVGSYHYFSEFQKNKNYFLYYRKKNEPESQKELLLDINEIAEGSSFCNVDQLLVSPDPNIFAYCVDLKGQDRYSILFKDITTGQHLTDEINDTMSIFAWGKTKDTIYYVTFDNISRPYKLWKHTLGTPQSKDVCIYTENDLSFQISMVARSRSERMILFELSSADTSEVHFIDLEKDDFSTQIILGRIEGVEYHADHHQDNFFIVTNNENTATSKVVIVPVSSPNSTHWDDFIPNDPSITFTNMQCFQDFIVLQGRQNGFEQNWAVKFDDENKTLTSFSHDEPVYHMKLGENFNFNTSTVRFVYSTLSTPSITYDQNVVTQKRTPVTRSIVANYTSSLYETQRLYATADDGTKIPISIVFRKDLKKPGTTSPVYLTGYGAYGVAEKLMFKRTLLPLLDRGFIYAIAHVRGGGCMGTAWHDSGKLLKKMNTFTDFINCAEHLIKSGMTVSSKLVIEGASAGGLLVGAVVNMRPDLFQVVVAEVPFVDVMATMSDPSLPLTTREWREWGNPNQKVYYDYMKKYSPIDNVAEKKYPHMWITCGLHDTSVPYWEPFKWVTKLREMNVGSSTILLNADLESGHSLSSKNEQIIYQKARTLAFVLDHV